jgi:hypothetical protein
VPLVLCGDVTLTPRRRSASDPLRTLMSVRHSVSMITPRPRTVANPQATSLGHLPLMRAGIRTALLLGAFSAPGVGYWVRSSQTGNAETAVDGLLWGAVVTIIALVGFAASFPLSAAGRLGRFAGGLIAVLIAWGLTLWWVSR